MATERLKTAPVLAMTTMLAAVFVVGCGSRDQTPAASESAAGTSIAETKGVEPAPVTEGGDPASGTIENGSSPQPVTASPGSAPPPSKREPIYDTEADGKALLAVAMEQARSEHKHVLVEWGGNWCGWCYKLHDIFTNDEDVRPIVFEEFELVLLDSGANRALMEQYGAKDRQYSFPHLTVLDAEGNVLVNQNTEPLEEGSRHDPVKVAEFLKKWTPQPLDAEELLALALQEAAADDKRVLMHVGTPYCGWCHVLSKFLREHESVFASDYVDLKLDTMRMTDGEAVAARFRPAEAPGVPWMVILDLSGKVLATSVGPDGNCGYPYRPAEIDHFLSMLTETRQRMTDDDLAVIRADLELYREERERSRLEQASASPQS